MDKITITYKQFKDGSIMIKDIKNVMSLREIRELEYGDEILRRYEKNKDMIYSIGDNKRIVGFQNNLEGTISYNYFHDKVLKSDEFKELVNKIKTISDKFKEIRNSVISDMEDDSNILKIIID